MDSEQESELRGLQELAYHLYIGTPANAVDELEEILMWNSADPEWSPVTRDFLRDLGVALLERIDRERKELGGL